VWLAVNNLKLNDNKTEFVIIGSKYQLSLVDKKEIKIGTETIPASNSARNIGAMFDASMKMTDQVNQVTRSCYAHLRAISKIRKYLTIDAATKLIHAFVTSRLDSNNSLLYGIHDYHLHKLQLIQNNSARLIAKKKKSDHITPTLISLHWLPISFRIQYKVLLLAFKCQHNLAPVYLADLLKTYVPSRPLRSVQQHKLVQPKSRLTKFGDRAFSICAPRLWNRLPCEIKEAGSVDIFKGLLKTHLFKLAYNV
jgi:hypothetical protein